MSLAVFARARREALGLTQEQVAEQLAVKRTYYLGIELGNNKLPRPEIRRKLAEILRVRHLDLLVAAGQLTAQEADEGLVISARAQAFAPFVDMVDDAGLKVLEVLARELRAHYRQSRGLGGDGKKEPAQTV